METQRLQATLQSLHLSRRHSDHSYRIEELSWISRMATGQVWLAILRNRTISS
jgi:hypothetical protein